MDPVNLNWFRSGKVSREKTLGVLSLEVLLEIQTITANCFYIFPILHQREPFLETPLLHKFSVTD